MAAGFGAHYTPKIKAALDVMKEKLVGRLEGHYQHEGVRWMLYRELETDEPGGILADAMGLGKTMQAIALMRANPLKTLIITTIPTLSQWQSALFDFGGFRPIVVNSSYRGILPATGVEVVITGYSSFQLASGKGPQCLKDYEFERIILDEGHSIRNAKTRLFKEVSELKGVGRRVFAMKREGDCYVSH